MNFMFKKQHHPTNKEEINNLITFSTCFYILKSKFPVQMYLSWISNLLSIVNNFNLVIYTNKETFAYIINLIDRTNKKIKIINKDLTEFYTYKYKDNWINNHKSSNLQLHKHIDWELNMLWNEKVFLVNETVKKGYFNSLYYGWCDIGYFRNRINDLHSNELTYWPNPLKLLKDYSNKGIHYGCVQNDLLVYNQLTNDITNHYKHNLLEPPTKQYEHICFAGGFFMLTANQLDIYVSLYESKLTYYFENNFFIKDDQTIIQDIILTNQELFCIHRENNTIFDNWFMFQRLLL